MLEIILYDDWKKESKTVLFPLILSVVIGIAGPLTFYFMPQSDSPLADAIKIAIIFGIVFCLTLYWYLYSIFYKIEVTKESIFLRTLFGKKEIKLCDLNAYTYKKYSKVSELYKFKLQIDKKSITVYTHYFKEFDEILKSQKTEE